MSGAALSAERLRALAPAWQVEVLSRVDSTNSEARRRLAEQRARPLLLAAEEQTAGRGRQGKSFYSPPGSGVYMTMLAHPRVPLTDAVTVTARAAVAVCRALRRLTGEDIRIKWVNDLYLRGGKLCGILVEAVSDYAAGITESLIIGVGINVTTAAFPPELPDAVALEHPEVSREEIIAAVAEEMLRELTRWEDRSYLTEYRAWSLVLGREVCWLQNGVRRTGRAVAIDEQGGLVVEETGGARTTLQSGEITLRLAKP